MRIAVFGATGRSGARFVAAALARDHTIRALARDPSKLPDAPGLEVLHGEMRDAAAVESTIVGCDAVLSALGARRGEGGMVRSEGIAVIVAAMARTGVRRVVAVAGGGILDAPGGGLRRDRPDYPAVFRAVGADHLATWQALAATDLEWTLFCPPDIPDRAGIGTWRTEVGRMPEGPGREIPTGDLAAAMLAAIVGRTFVGVRVGIKS